MRRESKIANPAGPTTLRHGLRLLAVSAVLAVASAACVPVQIGGEEAPGGVPVAAERSSGVWIVRVPDDRPDEGLLVARSSGQPFHVPAEAYPEPGRCRIWITSVRLEAQDPPGDCGVLRILVPTGDFLIEG